jgi:SAM-dependent methyltransferase
MVWYEELFTQDYDRIYFPTFTAERNVSEVEFIANVLQIPSNAKILDLACGHGRHALELARRGYQVTGLDLSPRFIQMAREAAQQLGLSQAHFVQADMKDFHFNQPFDAVYCYFTSFGYFTDEENNRVLRNVAACLAPRGRFLLETVNRDFAIHKVENQPRRWDEPEPGFFVLEDVCFNARTSRIHTSAIIIEQGKRRMVEYDIKMYTHAELEDMLEEVGLTVVDTFGNKDLSTFAVASPRMAIVAEKKPERKDCRKPYSTSAE